MAQRINETKYKNMISGLYHFAGTVYTKASEMQIAALVVKQALGENDTGAKEAYNHVKHCQEKYAIVVEEAKRIAQLMQEELDDQLKERNVWQGTE